MEGVSHLRQAEVGGWGRGVEFGRRFHCERFVRAFLVEFADEGIEAALLLQCVHAGRACRLPLQGAMHALMATVLLRMTGPDALDPDAEPEPEDGQLQQVVEPVSGGNSTSLRPVLNSALKSVHLIPHMVISPERWRKRHWRTRTPTRFNAPISEAACSTNTGSSCRHGALIIPTIPR